MPEDVYDFEGLNPGELLTVDEHAQPFDYATRLREKGHTRHSPPDAGGLFQALATDYVPSRVVDLPPKVVTKIKVVRSLGAMIQMITFGCFFILPMLVGIVAFYILVVGFGGIVRPYQDLTDFLLRTQMQPGASCTIASAQMYSHTEDGGDSGPTTYYDPTIGFTIRTPDGRGYRTTEYDAPSFTSWDDAKAYLSQHQIDHVYSCWYDPADPTVAMFINIGFGDIAGLFGWFFVFLFAGVLPNALLIWALGRAFVRRRRERRASRAASIVSQSQQR